MSFIYSGKKSKERFSNRVEAYEPMMEALRNLFKRNQDDGKVFIDYETEIFWGEV